MKRRESAVLHSVVLNKMRNGIHKPDRSFRLVAAVALAALFSAAASIQAAELPPPASKRIDFAGDIQPIFQGRCQVCHGEAQQQSGLRLDRRDAAMKGGYSGPVILPHNSAESKLIRMVGGLVEGVIMPPVGERLTTNQIGVLRAWIDQGALWPDEGGDAVSEESGQKPELTHWAYQPLEKPDPPAVKNSRWVRNPIDAFVLARLEEEGVSPSPQASKYTLIRRVSLDWTGLPPSPREVAAFVADAGPRAFEKVVERLLESKHYGEKWAMQWLDLARYADSDGYEKDLVRPHAWRYRHWVINALNDDMPFDRFTIEQIAGNLLPKSTVEQKVATGFHRNTLKNREGGVKIEQFRFEEVIDRTNTVGTVWLGLTVGCAQCHDHKYDPITQKDYYNFFAFFNNADEVNIDAPLAGEMGPYLAKLPEYRQTRDELLRTHCVYELMPPWEEKMRLVGRNPGKWTDWDHARDALEKYFDNGPKIVEKDPSERTRKEQDGLIDHFVKNYHRVITKELQEKLNYKEVFKKLQELKHEYPVVDGGANHLRKPRESQEPHSHSWGVEPDRRRGKARHSGLSRRLAQQRQGLPPGPRTLDRLGRKPAHAARRGQPYLAGVLRRGLGPDVRKLREPRRPTVSPRIARLVGLGIRRPGMEPEETAPPDCDLGDLPAVVGCATRFGTAGLPESTAGASTTPALARGAGTRLDIGRQRSALSQGRWQERAAAYPPRRR